MGWTKNLTSAALFFGLSMAVYKYRIDSTGSSTRGGAAQYYEPARMPMGSQVYSGVGGGNVPQMSGGDLAQMQPHATPGGQTF